MNKKNIIIFSILIILNIIASYKIIKKIIILLLNFLLSNIQIILFFTLIIFLFCPLLIYIYKLLLKISRNLYFKYWKNCNLQTKFVMISTLIILYAMTLKCFWLVMALFLCCFAINIKKEYWTDLFLFLKDIGINEIKTPWLGIDLTKIKEMEETVAKFKVDKKLNPKVEKYFDILNGLDKDDNIQLQLTLIQVSIEIEKNIRELAKQYDINVQKLGLIKILNILNTKKLIPYEINILIRDFWPVRNNLIHQNEVFDIPKETLEKILQLGLEILSLLKAEKELNLNN